MKAHLAALRCLMTVVCVCLAFGPIWATTLEGDSLLRSRPLPVAQHTQRDTIDDQFSLGIGLGMDYGGVIGLNFVAYPVKQLGIFVGAGYNLVQLGYNAGFKLRIINKPQPKAYFYFIGMYGYNAVIKVTDAPQHNRVFYGPSIGFGVETYPSSPGRGRYSIALVIPFRKAEVDEYMDNLQSNYGVVFSRGLAPVAISLGYRFGNAKARGY